jgi:hypothetical protein
MRKGASAQSEIVRNVPKCIEHGLHRACSKQRHAEAAFLRDVVDGSGDQLDPRFTVIAVVRDFICAEF